MAGVEGRSVAGLGKKEGQEACRVRDNKCKARACQTYDKVELAWWWKLAQWNA